MGFNLLRCKSIKINLKPESCRLNDFKQNVGLYYSFISKS